MNFYASVITLVLNVALAASAHYAIDPHGSLSDPTEKSSMMRRERPKPLLKANEVLTEEPASRNTISINAQGKQIVSDHADREPHHKGTESQLEIESSQAHKKAAGSEVKGAEDAAPKVEPVAETLKIHRIEAGKLPDEKRVEIPRHGAALTQQEEADVAASGTSVQVGIDEKNRNAAKLSAEEEELYYRLFPEDREVESRAAVSALEVSGQKPFRIKVPVSGGRRLCLTEQNHGYDVRAEPCRRNSHRQKWYWLGSKLKNLFSKGRCLGWAHSKHHLHNQADPNELASFIQESKANQKESASLVEESKGHHHGKQLSMNFHCSDQKAPLKWQIDEQGRLKSAINSQCMAINEHEDFRALVLPCVGEHEH